MRWPAELPRGLLITGAHPRAAKKPENEECDGVRRGYDVLMGLIDCQEMRELEEKVFQAGASAEALMDKVVEAGGEVSGLLDEIDAIDNFFMSTEWQREADLRRRRGSRRRRARG